VVVGCRDLTTDETYYLWVIYGALQANYAPWCAAAKYSLGQALAQHRVKAATYFPSGSQLGATDMTDHYTYIREDIIPILEVEAIPVGHEAMHQAGYGQYPDHQSDMDGLAYSCMGNIE
jgi:hypothetical protein